MSDNRNRQRVDDVLFTPTLHPVGSRLILNDEPTHSRAVLYEAVVVEWSPHVDCVKLQYDGSGQKKWINCRHYIPTVVDVLPALSSIDESFESMRQWGEETFGPGEASRLVERAREEMENELIPAAEHGYTREATEEAADVVLILTRFPGLWEALQKKMRINRSRQWKRMDDGTGYHVDPQILIS